MTLTTSCYRIESCSLFKVVEVDGYICEALDPASPSPSEVLSEYFGRPVHLVVKGPKRRTCNPTQTFPDLDASAVYHDGFPLLVTSDESLEKVGEEINRWADGEVNGESIGGIDDMWKTSRVPIERCASTPGSQVGNDTRESLISLNIQVPTEYCISWCWCTLC